MQSTKSGLAVAAFGISVLSLLRTAGRSLVDFPRVSVIVSKHVRVEILNGVHQATSYRFRVNAINTGHADTVVADVGLEGAGYGLRVEQLRMTG